jgi:hypothetical protein
MSIKRFAAGGLLKCALAMTAGGFARKRASIHVIKLGGCKGTNVFNGAHCRTPCRRTIPPADIQTRLAVAPSAITPPMSFALGRGGCVSKAAAGTGDDSAGTIASPGRVFGGPYRGIHHPKGCRCTDYCRASGKR